MHLAQITLAALAIIPSLKAFNINDAYNPVQSFREEEKVPSKTRVVAPDPPTTTHDLFDGFEDDLQSSLIALNEFDPGANDKGITVAERPKEDDPIKDASILSKYDSPRATHNVFEEVDLVNVSGGSQRTCSFEEAVNRVTILMKTEGRPLTADVDLWQGPDNTPQKMTVYLEDGCKRPFRAIVETPGSSNSIAIRNRGQMELPLTAGIEVDKKDRVEKELEEADYKVVQGGDVYTENFTSDVQSVRVSLKTHGRPLDARVEILQGPNNGKQVMEIYTDNGLERPFNVIIDTPGNGNVINVENTASMVFPFSACMEPYIVSERKRNEPIMKWSHNPMDEKAPPVGTKAPSASEPKQAEKYIETLASKKNSGKIFSYLDYLFLPENRKALQMVTTYLTSLAGPSNYEGINTMATSIDNLFEISPHHINGDSPKSEKLQNIHADILTALFSIRERLSSTAYHKSLADMRMTRLQSQLKEQKHIIEVDLNEKLLMNEKLHEEQVSTVNNMLT